MRHDVKYWQYETIANYDVAMSLAGMLAGREGLIPRTTAWSDRTVEIYLAERARLEPAEEEAATA